MHHIHRQILAAKCFQPIVITQKVENRDVFPFEPVFTVNRSGFRWISRSIERHFTHRPWQATAGEVNRVLKILRDEQIDALHLFFGNVAVHWLPLLRRIEIPVVVSFHGADGTGEIASVKYREARHEIFHRAKWIACRSRALARRVIELGCPAGKTTVLRTVIPSIPFVERSVPENGPIRLVQAARLIPKKGISTTIKAFARLRARRPGLNLVIAGTGPDEESLRKLVDELQVAESVEFVGFLSQNDLHDLFRQSHIFVHPSEEVEGDSEGVPNALLEAMACGLPVVTTHHGGIPEVVEDSQTGLLCEEADDEGLAIQIDRLIEDPQLYAHLAENGASMVLERFSAAAARETMMTIYT